MGAGLTKAILLPPKDDEMTEEEKTELVCRSLVYDIAYESCAHTVASVRFINFDLFRNFGGFPRYPDNADLTTALDDIDRDNALLVYVSHNWYRVKGREYTHTKWNILGKKTITKSIWQGDSHPDDPDGEKYKLLMEGIERAKKAYAAAMKECYLFIDYCCINQDGNPTEELMGQFDMYIQNCDCLFTPIYDPDIIHAFKFNSDTRYYIHSEMYGPIHNYFNEYPAQLWCSGPDSYLSRGWCRLEMCFAAALPVALDHAHQQLGREEHYDPEGNRVILYPPRLDKLSGNLRLNTLDGRRPHLIYGSYESLARQAPTILPSFHNKYNFYLSYFEKYWPITEDSFFTVQADKEVVRQMLTRLEFHVKEVSLKADVEALRDGYEGERNADGDFHGFGSYKYIETGNYYSGDWENHKKSGQGKMKYGNGDAYEGEWQNDLRHGKGTLVYNDGDMYEGEFESDLKCGKGVYTYSNQHKLVAEFKEESIHGGGVMTGQLSSFKNVAQYHEGQRIGSGEMTFSHDFTYEGNYRPDGHASLQSFQNKNAIGYTGPSKGKNKNKGNGAQTEALGDPHVKKHLVGTAVQLLTAETLKCFSTGKFPQDHPLLGNLRLFSSDYVERAQEIRNLFRQVGQEVDLNPMVPARRDAVLNSMGLVIVMKPVEELLIMMAN